MATLANRDWYVADVDGNPLRVRCLSQNYILGTARVVDSRGNYDVVDAHALKHTPEEVVAMELEDKAGE